jgi:hypothetical protein
MFWRRTNSPLRLSTKDGSRTTFGEWRLGVQIEGLDWLQNSPPFDAVAIVAPDPRVWAVHKLWLSRRADRQPIKRHRDAAQAEAVVASYLTHLPFEADQLRMLPKELVADAAPLFVKTGTSRNS